MPQRLSAPRWRPSPTAQRRTEPSLDGNAFSPSPSLVNEMQDGCRNRTRSHFAFNGAQSIWSRLPLRRSARPVAFRLFSRAATPAVCCARRRLAYRTKMTAAPGHHDPSDFLAATKARPAIASVDSVVLLIVPREAARIDEIGNGRAAQLDRLQQDFAEFFAQRRELGRGQARSDFRRMDSRFPQAFVSVDVTHAAQHALIEEQSFDAGSAGVNTARKFPGVDIKRIGAESPQFFRQR